MTMWSELPSQPGFFRHIIMLEAPTVTRHKTRHRQGHIHNPEAQSHSDPSLMQLPVPQFTQLMLRTEEEKDLLGSWINMNIGFTDRDPA